MTDEHKAKIAAAVKGKKHSRLTKIRMSKAQQRVRKTTKWKKNFTEGQRKRRQRETLEVIEKPEWNEPL